MCDRCGNEVLPEMRRAVKEISSSLSFPERVNNELATLATRTVGQFVTGDSFIVLSATNDAALS